MCSAPHFPPHPASNSESLASFQEFWSKEEFSTAALPEKEPPLLLLEPLRVAAELALELESDPFAVRKCRRIPEILTGKSGKTEVASRSGLFVVAEVEVGVHLLRVQEIHEQLG